MQIQILVLRYLLRAPITHGFYLTPPQDHPRSVRQTFLAFTTTLNRALFTPHNLISIAAIPPDLRISRLPLHDRLSPASAGLPGDDANDIHLLREDWVMETARKSCDKTHARSDLRHVFHNLTHTLSVL